MNKVYAYARISTKKQNIERQNRNILELYPNATLINETFTGTTNDRKEWNKLFKSVKQGDTIVFDSVSRMSRNAKDGISDYMNLFDRGIELVFIKEPHINTSVFKQQLENAKLGMTDNKIVNAVLEGVEKALMLLAEQQIEIAFEQAEKEVKDLSQRTIEGLITAKAKGNIGGRRTGSKVETKKYKDNKAKIIKLSKSFNGTLKDSEVLELLDIDRTTYYRYKKQIKAELEGKEETEKTEGFKKVCSSCKVEKQSTEFYNNKKTKDGKSYCCKECQNKRSEENRVKNLMERGW